MTFYLGNKWLLRYVVRVNKWAKAYDKTLYRRKSALEFEAWS